MAVEQQMREDWNRRAREDAHYYVAFGRHNQDDGEFFGTANEVVYGLEVELKRFGKANRRAMRALEIGCGPGRLMKPLSRHFGEIHGVDVSDEMVALARRNLADIPHAHAQRSFGADLRQFADESFDFVYSYAVFQHIPDREVVLGYLKEARRVLKTGGLLWFQVNGLPFPPLGGRVDTWSGVRFTADELMQFANAHDFQMYILEGTHTQYMWTSMCKRPEGWFRDIQARKPETGAFIAAISNPHSTEPAVPRSGRFACASLWMERLHPEVGLNHLGVWMGGAWGTPNYIAAHDATGRTQVNVLLPEGLPTGLVPVRAEWLGDWVGPEAIMRVRAASPMVPRLESVTDATDLLLGTRIRTRSVRVAFVELADPSHACLKLDGRAVDGILTHCVDPRKPQWDLVFALPDWAGPGPHELRIAVGKRNYPVVQLQVEDGGAAAPY
jgi:ubiquinone/menaquinone biosynthesis C-methylase UbiE